jgi:hypothetical protein
VAVVEWNSPLNPTLIKTSDMSWPLVSNAILTGTYRGLAWISYADGVVKKWDGEFNLTLNPTLGNSPQLLQLLGLLGAPGSSAQTAPLEFKVFEKVVRI